MDNEQIKIEEIINLPDYLTNDIIKRHNLKSSEANKQILRSYYHNCIVNVIRGNLKIIALHVEKFADLLAVEGENNG